MHIEESKTLDFVLNGTQPTQYYATLYSLPLPAQIFFGRGFILVEIIPLLALRKLLFLALIGKFYTGETKSIS